MDAGAAQGIGLATGKTGSKEGVKVSLFEFLRDVLIASIEKGQFPAALIAIIALSMIWRMPPADIGKLVFRLLDVAQEAGLMGYVASVLCLFSWFRHARYQRRLLEKKLKSSEGGRK